MVGISDCPLRLPTEAQRLTKSVGKNNSVSVIHFQTLFILSAPFFHSNKKILRASLESIKVSFLRAISWFSMHSLHPRVKFLPHELLEKRLYKKICELKAPLKNAPTVLMFL